MSDSKKAARLHTVSETDIPRKEDVADSLGHAMENLNHSMIQQDQRAPIPFAEFLNELTATPSIVMRNVFQVLYDMVKYYVGESLDESPEDPESISYARYDCSRMFIEGADHPFFADRLFANRLVNLVESMKRGTQQNKIYIFKGPHGCGKSTFLNNLLKKFEEYTALDAGSRFETVWRLERSLVEEVRDRDGVPLLESLLQFDDHPSRDQLELMKAQSVLHAGDPFIEVPCPSHDHPILMIPKAYRRIFLDDLFKNDAFKWKLFTEKEYEWVFRDTPCTICSSLYQALVSRLKSPKRVYEMIYARPYRFDRRLGNGISVYNPGDKPVRRNILGDAFIQSRINSVLRDSNRVRYTFSRYAKTNNGIYALMDIKAHNTDRFIELHNIISEGIHKVEDIEENVNSLLLAVMNPEDEKNIQDLESFLDRIEYIKIPYVMDLNTEVEIYRNIFGKHIDESFLPRVLHNFARVIIASRLNTTSEAMREWIEDPQKYRLYCDDNLQLLKMEIYAGNIPSWLSEKDRKRLTDKRWRKIIAESETEGDEGISGRDAIKIFNEFYSTYAKQDKLIDMSLLCIYFTKIRKELGRLIPTGFLDSLVRLYDYTVLQEVKESLYYYNEEQISRDIQNYLFAVNFEPGAVETSNYTGQKLEITEEFFKSIETRLLGSPMDKATRRSFRQDIQKEYTSRTLTQEIMVEGRAITETEIYQTLHERYAHNLKEKVLDPLLENNNFRRAIKDFGEEDFKTYDKKIREDVTYLINNLCQRYHYTEMGAKKVCIYVIDADLARKFVAS